MLDWIILSGSVSRRSKLRNQKASLFVQRQTRHGDSSSQIKPITSLTDRKETIVLSCHPFCDQAISRMHCGGHRGRPADGTDSKRRSATSAEYFVSRKPPYKFDEKRSSIYLHPDWCTYFQKNISIVRAWVLWHWLLYMQKCNPNVPGLA
jgi:hypothetical protein